MKYIKVTLILLIITILFTGCQSPEIGTNEEMENKSNLPIENPPKEEINLESDPIKDSIATMTLEEKLGQLLIVGFEGTSISDQLAYYINDLKIGGYIFFARNISSPDQTIELIKEMENLNKNNKFKLFISIDEEGGRVSRLPKEFAKLPSPGKVGSMNNKDLAYEFACIINKRLNYLGFNTNYNPLLDINSNPNNPVIGDRAFGSEPQAVINSGIEAIRAGKDENIISVVKHFPGHGDTSLDSHINLPLVGKDLDQLMEFELLPFIEAIKEGVDGIMIAHILYPNIDETYPATMSEKIINDLLRDKLNYQGLVFSDDMTMGAIIENYSLEEGVLKFIKSGGDQALVCHGSHNPKLVIDRLLRAVEEGDLEEKSIDEKLYRILKTKEKLNTPKEDLDLNKINQATKDLIKDLK